MHVVIINGSPRLEKYSNTDKIIQALKKGAEILPDRNIFHSFKDLCLA